MEPINFRQETLKYKVLRLENFDRVYGLIRDCAEAMWKNGLDQWNPDYPNVLAYKAALRNGSVFGFYLEDELIGTVTIDENQSQLYEVVNWQLKGEKIGVVHWLAVAPSMQGKGLGRSIMETIHQKAIELGLDVLRLDAYSKNPKILKMYEGLGYSRCSEIFIYEDKPGFICFERILN